MFRWWLSQKHRHSHACPRSGRKAARRRAFLQPQLELLEDRITPATVAWTGLGSTSDWSDPNNWFNEATSQAQVPQNGDDLVFRANAAQLTSNDDLQNVDVVGNIIIEAGGYHITSTASPPFGVTATSITTSSAATGAPIDVDLDFQLRSTGGFPVTVASAQTVLRLNGKLHGSTGLQKDGIGLLRLGGDNDYDGLTAINSGVLIVASNTALGSAVVKTTVAAGAALEFEGDLDYTNPEAVTLNGPGVANAGAINAVSGSTTFAGAITLASDSTIGALDGAALTLTGNVQNGGNLLTVNGAGDTTLTGQLSGPGGLAKADTGTLLLSGLADFTGATHVTAGNLLVSASGSVGSSTITLDGGLIGGGGSLADLVVNGGTVSPGGTDGSSTGILRARNVELHAAARFAPEINGPNPGTDFDQLQASGTVALGDVILDATSGFTASVGQSFTLVTTSLADGLTGTFRQQNSNGSFNHLSHRAAINIRLRLFRITYTTTSGTVTRVKLPAATVLVANPSDGAAVGRDVTFTASLLVVGGIGQNSQPTGEVTFTANSTIVAANVPVGRLGLHGISFFGAVTNTNALAAGNYVITAQYRNDPNIEDNDSTLAYQVGGLPITDGMNRSFVDHLYLDILGKTADAGGENFWTTFLDQGRFSRTQIVQFIQLTPDYANFQLNLIYQDLLNRSVDPDGFTFWSAVLAHGGKLDQVRQAVTSSQEYFQIHANHDIGTLLDILYQDALGRAADPSGLAFWTSVLQQQSPSSLQATIAGSVVPAFFSRTNIEHQQVVVERYYDKVYNNHDGYLNRPVDSPALDFLTASLVSKQLTENTLIAFLVSSDEYFLAVQQ